MSDKTHYIDTEVEEESWNSWDDYETYCANGEKVFNAIVDEASLYKIASTAVKQKLESLNNCAKSYRDQYLKEQDKNYELKKQIQELQLELQNTDKKIEDAKLESSREIYENYYRSLNPKHIIEGDKFYIIDKKWNYKPCEYCGGTHKITTQTGKEVDCPKCNQNGTVTSHISYEISECICISYWHNSQKNVNLYYGNNDKDYCVNSNDITENAYTTKEEAEKVLNEFYERNRNEK